MLLPAAVACGLLWLGAIVVAGSQLSGSGLIALGIAGLLLTGTLLLLIQSQHKRLLSLAATDALTGLANHRGFHETLRAEIDRGLELARPVALVTLDLDNFKSINDTHGHPYGDTILSAVGSALRDAIRSNDTAARIGGEEFALVLPGSDGEAAFVVAERARANVAAIAVRGFELSCSAGIAAFPADAEDASVLCQLADSALYWAKRGGKRRTRRFDPDHSPATWSQRQRAEIESLLAQERADPPRSSSRLSRSPTVASSAMRHWPASRARAGAPRTSGSRRRTAADSARSSRRRRSARHSSRSGVPSMPTSRSTSARPRSRSRSCQRPLRGNLEGIVIEITEHEFVPDDDSLAGGVADLRGAARGSRSTTPGPGTPASSS